MAEPTQAEKVLAEDVAIYNALLSLYLWVASVDEEPGETDIFQHARETIDFVINAAVEAKLREMVEGITVQRGHCSVCDRVVAAIRVGAEGEKTVEERVLITTELEEKIRAMFTELGRSVRAAVAAETERCAGLCTAENMGKEIVCPEECAAAIRAGDEGEKDD
jgi:hypothetical protein